MSGSCANLHVGFGVANSDENGTASNVFLMQMCNEYIILDDLSL